MYNIIGLIIVLFFVAVSSGWRGKLLPLIIASYYAIYMLIDLSQFSFVHELSDTIIVSDRDVASSYLLTSNLIAMIYVVICCISTTFNKRGRIVPLSYAAWLLVVIFANTAIHIFQWDGHGVSSAIITIFQLSCVAADGLASMLGGDNFISRYIANHNRSDADNNRRGTDFKNTSEYSQ